LKLKYCDRLANIVVVGILWFVLKRENEEKVRAAAGKDLGEISQGDWQDDDDPRWIFQL
jgi:hypothetical protein